MIHGIISLKKSILKISLMNPSLKRILQKAKKYGVTATPVLVVADKDGELLETYIGGMPITQNIRKLWDKYEIPHKD